MYINSWFEGKMTINEGVYRRMISRLWFRRDIAGAEERDTESPLLWFMELRFQETQEVLNLFRFSGTYLSSPYQNLKEADVFS